MEYILTVTSEHEDGVAQYMAFIPVPNENKRIMEVSMLVRKINDSLKFERKGDLLCHVDSGEGVSCTPIHPLIGKLLELEYQAELQQIMHPDWDSFKLVWNPLEYVNWTKSGTYVWLFK